MANSKGKHIDFIVTTSDPNDASSAADNKRRVRSVAALKSWPNRRKKFFDQLEPTGASQSTFLIQRPETLPSQPAAKARKRKATSPSSTVKSTLSADSQVPSLGDDFDTASVFSSWSDATDDQKAVVPSSRGSNNGIKQARIPSPLPELQTNLVLRRRKRMADGSEKVTLVCDEVDLPTPPYTPGPSPSNGHADPFNCYPVDHKPWFDRILHHLLTIYAPRGWPALKVTESEGHEWEHFMTQSALSEPALFYVRLYFGSGDLVRLGVFSADTMDWLRLQAIRNINAALSDPQRATSDPLILAVGRIALSESLYGDRTAANTIHRPAQKRMINMRGGMKNLDFPAIVKRLMRWADRVMAMQTNTARILEDEDLDDNFTWKQSVDVLERWVPREGESLRQKVQISNLVTDGDDT